MRSAVLVVLLTTIGVIGAVPVAASADVPAGAFYADSDGSGSTCSSALPCSLTTAIDAADAASTSGAQTVALEADVYPGVDLDLTDPISIVAADPSAGEVQLTGAGPSDDVITVDSPGVSLTGLTVRAGNNGLTIDNDGSATVTGSDFSYNSNDGIADYGLTSTFDNVSSEDNGGSGIEIGGGTAADPATAAINDSSVSINTLNGVSVIPLLSASSADVTIRNSTSYQNVESGVFAAGGGDAEVIASTVVDNASGLSTVDTGQVLAGADLLAANSSAGGSDCAASANVVDDGYNISDDASCASFLAADGSTSDSSTLAASVGTIEENGGGTGSLQITADSPAATQVTGTPAGEDPVCGAPDQRGLTRPAGVCAAGSFDPGSVPITPSPTLTIDPTDGAIAFSDISLDVTITGPVGRSSGGTVSFEGTLPGGAATPLEGCQDIAVFDAIAGCDVRLDAGSYTFTATYSGGPTYAAANVAATSPYLVRYSTYTGVTIDSATHLTATVQGGTTSPPDGSVTFAVNGVNQPAAQILTVGTDSSTASITLSTPLSGASTVTAQYAGGDTFAPSSGSTTVTNPTITAKVTSTSVRSKYGWYRAPVTVAITCKPGSAPLDGSCPSRVTFTGSAAHQTQTVHATDTDGGDAQLTVGPVNLDRVKPTITITGVKAGHTYAKGTKLHPKCVAKDPLSGLAGECTLKVSHKKVGKKVAYTATAAAKDKAGNAGTHVIHWDIKTNK